MYGGRPVSKVFTAVLRTTSKYVVVSRIYYDIYVYMSDE